MKIGFIGLGKMGNNMVLHLLEKKQQVVVYNRSANDTKEISKKGAIPSYSIEELVSKLSKEKTKIIWLMIPGGKPVSNTIKKISKLLDKGDIIIDGGNSYFKDSQKNAKFLSKKGISFLDVGTSGGIEGARNGACMMIGGNKKDFQKTEFLYKTMCVKNGYGYMGKSGAGHFVKMVHNGIEYGMMSSLAEGFEAIKKYEKEFKIDLEQVSKVYNNGSIIESRLTTWLYKAFQNKNYLNKIKKKVPKGETENEMLKLTKLSNFPSLKTAINVRKQTRTKPRFAGKIISALRNKFGGHSFN